MARVENCLFAISPFPWYDFIPMSVWFISVGLSSEPQNHLEGVLKNTDCWAPPLEFLTRSEVGAQEFSFLSCFQLFLLLLVQGTTHAEPLVYRDTI